MISILDEIRHEIDFQRRRHEQLWSYAERVPSSRDASPETSAPRMDPLRVGVAVTAGFRPNPQLAHLLKDFYAAGADDKEIEFVQPKSLSVSLLDLTPKAFTSAAEIPDLIRQDLPRLRSFLPSAEGLRLAELKLVPQPQALWICGVPSRELVASRAQLADYVLGRPWKDQFERAYDRGGIPPVLWRAQILRWKGGLAPETVRATYRARESDTLGEIELDPFEIVLENGNWKIREPYRG